MILLPQKVAYRGTLTGLRISSIDGTAFIDNLSGATLDLGSSVVKATGTAAIRISSVDGTAFVDTSDATLAAALAANAGKYLVITDASGRYLKGWIKAAGTGETLGADVLAGFDFTSGWWTTDAAIVDANTFNATSAYGFVYKPSTLTQGSLYKGSFDAVNSAGVSEVRQSGGARILADGATGSYFNAASASSTLTIRSNAISTVDVVTLTLEQVLAPSTDGCTIVSTKGGTTYNFESKDASFTYNAASYTYAIYDRDVTALADGNHLVEIYDASGRMLRGYLGAAGTGETLGDELFKNGDCSSDTGWVLDTGWSISGGKLVKGAAVGSSAYGYQNIAKTAGALYFGSFDVDSISSSNTSLALTGTPLSMMPVNSITGTRTGYATYQSGSGVVGAYLSINRDIATAQYDNFSLKRVLTPSATGATIVSAKGGATENFAYKDASFAYNEASYYCLIKRAR